MRDGQGRPLSKFPFELRFRGGTRMGHVGEGHCSQWNSKYKVPRAKHVNLFEGNPRHGRKQALGKEFGFYSKSS